MFLIDSRLRGNDSFVWLIFKFIKMEIAENYKTSFGYDGIHHCEAAVLCCIDFRFWRQTMRFAEEHLGLKSYDFPKLPGAAKAINESTEGDVSQGCFCVPCDLHQAEKIVIVNHEDCGAYGGSSKFEGDKNAEEEFHSEELKKAREVINQKYPDKKVELYYARLSDDKQEVEFVGVE